MPKFMFGDLAEFSLPNGENVIGTVHGLETREDGFWYRVKSFGNEYIVKETVLEEAIKY